MPMLGVPSRSMATSAKLALGALLRKYYYDTVDDKSDASDIQRRTGPTPLPRAPNHPENQSCVLT
jgi:hypothetical protein